MNAWLLETYLILWLHTCGLCWCELAGDFLRSCQQGHLKAWRYSMGKKKKNWRRGIPGCWGMRERDEGLAGEDTSLLWRKLPMRDPSGLEESHELMEGPMWDRGPVGYQPTQTAPAVLPLLPSLPQTWRSQKPNRKEGGLTIIHPYHH